MTVYEKFWNLDIDFSLIGLEKGDEEGGYFCTPIGAKVIGWECEGIHYCNIEGFDEMVFAVNPETAEEHYVRPLAKNFEELLSLVLVCKDFHKLTDLIHKLSKLRFNLFLFKSCQLTETHLNDSVSLLFGKTDCMFKFKVSILFAHSTGKKLRKVRFLKAFHKAFLTLGNCLT